MPNPNDPADTKPIEDTEAEPGRSGEAHDKPQGEGLGAPDKAATKPIEDTEGEAEGEAGPRA
jgi:hypothetical protein